MSHSPITPSSSLSPPSTSPFPCYLTSSPYLVHLFLIPPHLSPPPRPVPPLPRPPPPLHRSQPPLPLPPSPFISTFPTSLPHPSPLTSLIHSLAFSPPFFHFLAPPPPQTHPPHPLLNSFPPFELSLPRMPSRGFFPSGSSPPFSGRTFSPYLNL